MNDSIDAGVALPHLVNHPDRDERLAHQRSLTGETTMKTHRLDMNALHVESFEAQASLHASAGGDKKGTIICSAACGSAEVCQITSGSKCG